MSCLVASFALFVIVCTALFVAYMSIVYIAADRWPDPYMLVSALIVFAVFGPMWWFLR